MSRPAEALSGRVAAAALCIGSGLCGAQVAAQVAVAEPGAGDWISLFNGVDLDGWTPKIRQYPAGENFGETFRVEDGLLTVSFDADRKSSCRERVYSDV